jgi:glycosyltransferase involved in cell wall biosynthesis
MRARPLVVHVIDSLGRGGAEQQLVSNVLGLSDRFDALVVALGEPTHVAPPLRAAGIEVLVLSPERARKAAVLSLAHRLYRNAKAKQPALFHSSLFLSDAVAGLAGRALGVPVVGTFCSLLDGRRSPGVASWKVATENALWAAAKRLHVKSIAISEAVRVDAAASLGLPIEASPVIYRGTELLTPLVDAERAAVRHELGVASESFFVLSVGRLVAVKGHRYLLDALANPKLRDVPWTLCMVGEGRLEQALREQAARLGISDSIRWLGKRNDVRRLMQAADVFAFPSLAEGLGVSLVEAVATGLPSVVHDAPAMNEVVMHEENGLLVPLADSDALAQALLRIFEKPALRESLRAGCLRHGVRFERARSVAALGDFYGDVLERWR